jgi:hypothetical protein
MENTTSNSNPNAGKGLGIAGLVLGIIAVVFSFVPCLGAYAVFPGALAIVLSAISISQANKANAPKGLAIAGLVCSIVGTSIGAWQWYTLNKAANAIKEGIESIDTATIRKSIESIGSEVKEAIEESKKSADSTATAQ